VGLGGRRDAHLARPYFQNIPHARRLGKRLVHRHGVHSPERDTRPARRDSTPTQQQAAPNPPPANGFDGIDRARRLVPALDVRTHHGTKHRLVAFNGVDVNLGTHLMLRRPERIQGCEKCNHRHHR
jgi:hypothetical protein